MNSRYYKHNPFDEDLQKLEVRAKLGDFEAQTRLAELQSQIGAPTHLIYAANLLENLREEYEEHSRRIRNNVKQHLGDALTLAMNDLYFKYSIKEIFTQVYSRLPVRDDEFLILNPTFPGGGAFFGSAQIYSKNKISDEIFTKYIRGHRQESHLDVEIKPVISHFPLVKQKANNPLETDILTFLEALNSTGAWFKITGKVDKPRAYPEWVRKPPTNRGGISFFQKYLVISDIAADADFQVMYKDLNS